MTINRQWILTSRPKGMVSLANFEYRETPLNDAPLGPNEVLIRNNLFSLVPAQRTWMNADSAYFPPIPVGGPVVAPSVGEVVKSTHSRYPVGSKVSGMTAWEDYTLLSGERPMIGLLPEGVSVYDAQSLFGGNALTAYYGLLLVGQAKVGETVVVSGAAGSVGCMAAQIARIKGCNVIGIAGGKAKCEWLMKECKITAAIDYKSENVAARLKELAPKGVDVFFDNVGGTIMQDVIDQMAMFGRVAVCGQIAHYNTPSPAPGPRDMFRVIFHRLRIQGFISIDFPGERKAALADLQQWAKEDKLTHRTDVRKGFKNLPETYFELFRGGNDGTLMLEVD